MRVGRSAELDSLALRRIAEGNEDAFAQLFQAYYAELVQFATYYAKDVTLAEEAVGDVFLRLWRGREALYVTTTVRAFLFAAVRNRSLNVKRNDRRRQTAMERYAHAGDERSLGTSPAQQLERADTEVAIQRLLAQLPSQARLVLSLRWRQQMELHEMAAVLGISNGAVRVQLTRALQALRKIAGPELEKLGL